MSNQRMRTPPEERFEGREQVCDLNAVFEDLPGESSQRHGHMQKTINKNGRLTTAVFQFDAGAKLDPHAVEGEAVMHVLQGRLRVTGEDGAREVGPGQLWMLDPGVERQVEAIEPSRMLMHVVLE